MPAESVGNCHHRSHLSATTPVTRWSNRESDAGESPDNAKAGDITNSKQTETLAQSQQPIQQMRIIHLKDLRAHPDLREAPRAAEGEPGFGPAAEGDRGGGRRHAHKRRGVNAARGVIEAVSRAVGVGVIDGVDVATVLAVAIGVARRKGVALCAIVADGPGI